MANDPFFIKNGYKINNRPVYFDDVQTTNIVYQPHVYKLASYLATKIKAAKIIDIGIGNAEKLIKNCSNFELFGIDYGNNLTLAKKYPQIKLIECNLDKEEPSLSPEILNNSIIICSDIIEHLAHPDVLLKWLATASINTEIIIISTPERDLTRGYETYGPPENPAHVREWNLSEFNNLLINHDLNPSFLGLTTNNTIDQNKKTILAIYDKKINTAKNKNVPLKIKAIVTSYNEEDIIPHTIDYLTNQNIYVHCIDNWSNDNTFNIIKKKASENSLITYEQFPKTGPTSTYNWHDILTYIEQVASNDNADWIIRQDADEIRESPFTFSPNLKRAIEIVDAAGFNAIDFTCMDFILVLDGFNANHTPENFFKYFEFGKRPGHFLQIKAWKKTSDISIADSGGHHTKFINQKVFPYKFLLKHYPLRSQQQAKQKIFKDRKSRLNEWEKNELKWHIQYDQIDTNYEFLKNSACYEKYEKMDFLYKYLVERISGIGILKNNDQ